MIKYLPKNSVLLGLGLFSLLAVASCTDVNNELGEGLIPPYQSGGILLDSSFTVSTYTVTTEKFPTGTYSTCWLGSYNDPTFGNVTASVAGQLYPESLTTYKNKAHIADSTFSEAYLIFKLNSGVGDSTLNQKLTLYQMTGRLYADSVYYSNYPIKDSINTTPIGSGTYNRITNGYVKIPLTKAFVDRLLKVDTSKIADYNDFLDIQKGIYIQSEKLASGGGLNKVSFSDSSTIKVYYRLTKVNEPTVDSMAVLNFTMGSSNLKVGIVSHTYNGAIGSSDLDGTTVQPKTYVQGFGGVRTKVVFNPSDVAKWEDTLAIGANIHRVEMIIPLEDLPAFPNYNPIPNALTPYYQYNDTTLLFVSDMAVYSGVSTNAFLNRTKREYSINITNYFKNAMRDKTLPHEIFLYAGYPATLSSSSSSTVNYAQLPAQFLSYPSMGTLKGGDKIKIKITYSKL